MIITKELYFREVDPGTHVVELHGEYGGIEGSGRHAKFYQSVARCQSNVQSTENGPTVQDSDCSNCYPHLWTVEHCYFNSLHSGSGDVKCYFIG